MAVSLLAAFAQGDGRTPHEHREDARSFAVHHRERSGVAAPRELEVTDDRLIVHQEGGSSNYRSERIPGERVAMRLDIRCGWGGRDFHRTEPFSPMEQERLRQRIHESFLAQLAGYRALGVDPKQAIRGVAIHVRGYASPDGMAHPTSNQRLSERRAEVVEGMIHDELVRQGLGDVRMRSTAEGMGVEGSVQAFAASLGSFTRDGHRVSSHFAERVIAAIHDQDAGRLYDLLPNLVGHEGDLERAFETQVAAHRRVEVDMDMLLKPVEIRTTSPASIPSSILEAPTRYHDPHPIQIALPLVGALAFLRRRRPEQGREADKGKRNPTLPPPLPLRPDRPVPPSDQWFPDIAPPPLPAPRRVFSQRPKGEHPEWPKPPAPEPPPLPNDAPELSFDEDVWIQDPVAPFPSWPRDLRPETSYPQVVEPMDDVPPIPPPPYPPTRKLGFRREPFAQDRFTQSQDPSVTRKRVPLTKRIGSGGRRGHSKF